ncbi:MAG: [FeFe] hydrogenase H-cluster radical SAM maturase HydE [Candidatus Lernaella stagnicola]|nr:[FeFe] hydrogenase H-cluster radical SAM maturase HydE [Candidatus Lernaella stagnicola]
MPREAVETWLRETDPEQLALLWAAADRTRREWVGDDVHLRGLVEISNYCVRECAYCGIRGPNRGLSRYRMTAAEILDAAGQAREFGYGTVVLQSGEDYGIETAWLAEIIRQMKAKTGLAVTLSLGERPEADWAAWREVGADRYLLKFETSDEELYGRIHPPRPGGDTDRRLQLRRLRELGYENGGGVMVGLPGQSFASLARDIETFREMDLDMIGVGPFIAHPETPLGRGEIEVKIEDADQVPSTETMACRVVALTRIVCPEANLPSTTALETINRESGRTSGLQRGANVVMPNLTPPHFRALYDIYPEKSLAQPDAASFHLQLLDQLAAIDRAPGRGRGDRVRRTSST